MFLGGPEAFKRVITKDNIHITNTQRFQRLMYQYLFTECFMKISPQSLEQIQFVHSTEHSTTCDSRTHLNFTNCLEIVFLCVCM